MLYNLCMNFIYFLTFSFIIFLTSLIGYNKYRSTTFYALAIGGVVNANFFHAGNYPIICFNLPFGIDSIIYTLFIFCVIFMCIKENKKSAYLLSISSIVAIIFSALMQLVSSLLSYGNTLDIWKPFLTFMASSLASIITVIIIIEFLDKIKDKLNSYLLMIIGIVIASIINTAIYYPFNALINGIPSNLSSLLIASFIGKFIALLSSLFALFIIHKHENKQAKED